MIGLVVAPVASAYLPRLTQLVTQQDEAGLEQAFRMATQCGVLLAGVAATMLIVFGEPLVLVWTQDAKTSAHVAQLLPALAIGCGLHAIISIPYMLQLANGWTQLAIWLNIVLICIMVPSLLYVIPRAGALGATWVWAGVMLSYAIVSTKIMFRRLLPHLRLRWPLADVAAPLGLLALTGFLLSEFAPSSDGTGPTLIIIFAAASVLLLTGIFALPLIRDETVRLVRKLRAA